MPYMQSIMNSIVSRNKSRLSSCEANTKVYEMILLKVVNPMAHTLVVLRFVELAVFYGPETHLIETTYLIL